MKNTARSLKIINNSLCHDLAIYTRHFSKPLFTPEQITHYQEYATEKAMAVFIVLGVGGAPSMPEELYLIPLISISQIQSNPLSLKQYKRELVNKWFSIEEFKE